MYKILDKTQFSEKVFKFRIEAPEMAKHAHAGQFLMVRANETAERVPFTFADWNPSEGWVEFIFMVIGKTTTMLATYEPGDILEDVTGPLGQPTELGEGTWAVIGGGVGLAIAFPVARPARSHRSRGSRDHGCPHQGPASPRGPVPLGIR